VAPTLSSLADCKRERLAWRSLRRSSGRGDAARDDYRFEAKERRRAGRRVATVVKALAIATADRRAAVMARLRCMEAVG
jgi:hypothetical protein